MSPHDYSDAAQSASAAPQEKGTVYYAHTLPDAPPQDWQLLDAHLQGTARRAARFARAFGAEKWAYFLGILHDLGKGTVEFLERLRGKRQCVDHSSAAVHYVLQQWGTTVQGTPDKRGELYAWLMGYCLAGHHGGLCDAGATSMDTGTLCERQRRTLPQYAPPAEPIPAYTALEPLPIAAGRSAESNRFAVQFFVRMLFSCLVDADFLDTEQFCAPQVAALRTSPPSIDALADKLIAKLRERGFLPAEGEATLHANVVQQPPAPCGTPARQQQIRAARQQILHYCRAAAEQAPGVFSLTVPTGGGKTLSSLAFALEHAKAHGLRRVILVVSYTSIIEQNAQEFRDVLGEDAVLEHHCSYVHPSLEDSEDAETTAAQSYRLRTENWDASVIVTTSVQFFESLFAARVSSCRKLHNIAQSVIILDEAQMLPLALLLPTTAALQELARTYGSSIVLCTATQPALQKSSFLPYGLENIREIIPADILPALFALFTRTVVQWHGAYDLPRLREALRPSPQVLCIVNTRRRAAALYALCQDGENVFHLSSLMTPAHRSRILAQVRHCLNAGQPCCVISTSLIECGVDISFPVVWREQCGLDSVAQAAGRCNRHGEGQTGQVHIFESAEGFSKQQGELSVKAKLCRRFAATESLFAPQTVNAYFQALFSEKSKQTQLDEQTQLDKPNLWDLCTEKNMRFDYKKLARKYAFIDSDTHPVVIETPECCALLEHIRRSPFVPSTLLRRLQRYTVSVYSWEFEQLKEEGRLEYLHDAVYVLSGGLGYSEATGLQVVLDENNNVTDFIY